MLRIGALVLVLLAEMTTVAGAWGAKGHRIINGDAIVALPPSLPVFVRSPDAATTIAALGPEPDRLKGAGTAWDDDLDPGHYLDLDDDGTVAAVVPLATLPPTREAYDTALRSGHDNDGHPSDQYRAGYLPYSIVEGWQQIVKDFAIWRVDTYGEAHATGDARAVFTADRMMRETLTLRDIGYWGHFVGDGSQPLHVSVHFNGWGNYPNPHGYTQSHDIHANFETAFVNAHASAALVQSRIGPYVPSTQPIFARVSAYLATTGSGVPTVYQLAAAGAFDAGTPAGINFMLDRLAAGAEMMRDAIADAYVAAADEKVGYPGVSVRDVESGTVPPEAPDATP